MGILVGMVILHSVSQKKDDGVCLGLYQKRESSLRPGVFDL